MELPIQTKKKIKTTKTIYQKEIKEENEEELNKILNGENIALITPKLGITTSAIDPSKRHYEILEYIVDKEKRYKNNKEREELIQELEDQFVDGGRNNPNGKLKISGQWFTTAKASIVEDSNFERVIILSANTHTLEHAINQLVNVIPFNNLSTQIKQMSVDSQNKVLIELLKASIPSFPSDVKYWI